MELFDITAQTRQSMCMCVEHQESRIWQVCFNLSLDCLLHKDCIEEKDESYHDKVCNKSARGLFCHAQTSERVFKRSQGPIFIIAL